MANYTYTVLYFDAEVACGEGSTFEYARSEALDQIPAIYPREDLTFEATCDTGAIASVTGPCYL